MKKISWEHHQALRYALRIRKGVANGTDGRILADYVQAVSEQHLKPHFRQEEQALFSRLSDEQNQYPALQQVLKEHLDLPRLAAEISQKQGGDREQILRFAETIVSHVKLEETVLFPWIEQSLAEGGLRDAEAEIDQSHQSTELDWPTQFWSAQPAA